MFLEIAVVVVLVGGAYHIGRLRGRRDEARWWTGAVFAAGRGKLESLQAYITARNPRASGPHECPEELARHLVLPHVSDGGKAIILPADWAAAVGEPTPKQAGRSGAGTSDLTRAPAPDIVPLADMIHKRGKAG